MKTNAKLKFQNLPINLLLFLIGLGGAVYVKAFGTFAISETILASMGLFFILRRGIPKNFQNFLVLTLLWIAGILASSLYNQADILGAIKLIGSALLFFLDIFSFYFLLREQPQGAVFFVAGNMISYLLQFYYFPPPLSKEDFASNFNDAEHVLFTWIAMTHYVAMMSFSGILWFFGKLRLSILVLLVAGGGALYLGSRAYFLTGLISTLALCLVFFRPKRLRLFPRMSLTKAMALIVLVTINAGFVYKAAAISGVLGEYAYKKYEVQSEVEGFGVASGRLDFFVSLYAIARSPLLGYGPQAPDNDGIQADFFKLLGISAMDTKDDVPNHSHILGAWVWSGILSVPFWIFLIRKIFKGILNLNNYRLACICITYTIFVLWHIFFSPLAYRVDLCFIVGLFFSLSYGFDKHAKIIKQDLRCY